MMININKLIQEVNMLENHFDWTKSSVLIKDIHEMYTLAKEHIKQGGSSEETERR